MTNLNNEFSLGYLIIAYHTDNKILDLTKNLQPVYTSDITNN